MANTFLTSKEIARQALPILENNLVMGGLVYRDYSNTFAQKGDTIQVRKPAAFTAVEFDLEVKNLMDEVIFFEFEYQAGEFASIDTIWMLIRIDNDEEAFHPSLHYGKPQIPPQLKAHTSARGPISIWVPGNDWQKLELVFTCVNLQERKETILLTQVINKADL